MPIFSIPNPYITLERVNVIKLTEVNLRHTYDATSLRREFDEYDRKKTKYFIHLIPQQINRYLGHLFKISLSLESLNEWTVGEDINIHIG